MGQVDDNKNSASTHDHFAFIIKVLYFYLFLSVIYYLSAYLSMYIYISILVYLFIHPSLNPKSTTHPSIRPSMYMYIQISKLYPNLITVFIGLL